MTREMLPEETTVPLTVWVSGLVSAVSRPVMTQAPRTRSNRAQVFIASSPGGRSPAPRGGPPPRGNRLQLAGRGPRASGTDLARRPHAAIAAIGSLIGGMKADHAVE